MKVIESMIMPTGWHFIQETHRIDAPTYRGKVYTAEEITRRIDVLQDVVESISYRLEQLDALEMFSYASIDGIKVSSRPTSKTVILNGGIISHILGIRNDIKLIKSELEEIHPKLK